jgi:hypothetical protein
MPGGFGYGGFGGGPFGAYDLAEEVLWDDIPEQPDRVYDADPAGGNGALRGFQASSMGVLRIILDKLRDVSQLRDPETISTRFQDNISVEILGSAVEVVGKSIRVIVDGPGAAVDPFDPLGRVSCGWTLTDRLGREFIVDQVHKLTLSLIVVGNSLPATAAVPGVPDAVLRAPALIEHLGNDYGVDTDDNDPEAYQRASVRDTWQWCRRKGTDDGYRIIGDIFGHEVTVERLWYVGAVPSGSILAANLYEYPVGSGLYYTTLAPTRPLFDEIAADVIPTDLFCWEEPLWTTEGIVPPPGPLPDGTPVSEAIGSTMQGMVVVSSVETPPGSGIWRIRVTGDLVPVASAGLNSPHWYATFPSGLAGNFWLEATPVDIGGGDWTFDVVSLAGDPVGVIPGATANIDYWCEPQPDCDYCAASALKITIVPADVLTETGVIWEQMIARILAKVTRAIPIHVRFVLWYYTSPPVAAAFYVPGVHFIAAMV